MSTKLSKREVRMNKRQEARDATKAREDDETLFRAELIMRERAAVARATVDGAAAVGAVARGDRVTPGSQLFQDGPRVGGIGQGTDGSYASDGTCPQPFPSLMPSRVGGIGQGTNGSHTSDGTCPQPFPSLVPSGGTVTPLSHPNHLDRCAGARGG